MNYLNIVPQIHPDSKWHKISEDEYYLFNETLNSQMLISSSAISVIECIDGKNTIQEITDMLTENNSEDDDYRRIKEFI